MNWKFWRRNRVSIRSETMVDENSIAEPLLRAIFGGKNIDVSNALNVAAFSSAVEFVSGVVCSLPIKLYKQTKQRDEKEADGRPKYAVHELVDDRRVMLLNRASGDLIRSHEMIKRFVYDFYTSKGGFIYVNRIGNRCESLHYVDPRAVSVMVDETDHIFKQALFMVDGRAYFPWQFIYACRNSVNGVSGVSLVDQANDVLATAYNTQVFEKALMERGGNRRGYLQSERKVSEGAITKLKQAFRQMYSGENSDNVVVLNEGIKFQEASETSQEMQLAENKERQTNDVLSLFLIPPSLIQGGAYEDDHKKFINYALMPLLSIIEDALNNALLLESEKRSCEFKFDIKELTKANLKDRWTAWATAKKNGLVNADEFRRFEDMEPLGMDYINLGLQDVLMDPHSKKIIVPNMATVIDPDDLQPARAPRDPVSNEPTDNPPTSTDKTDNNPEGGEDGGDTSKR